jgi:uncharacterized cupredoxin-like copper-binding protein
MEKDMSLQSRALSDLKESDRRSKSLFCRIILKPLMFQQARKCSILKTSIASLTLLVALVHPALAEATVKVILWKKDGMLDLSKNMMMGMGMKEHMAGHLKNMAMMGIDTNVETVPAGKVTFEVNNTGKHMQHEMLISPIKDENAGLPFIDAKTALTKKPLVIWAKYLS